MRRVIVAICLIGLVFVVEAGHDVLASQATPNAATPAACQTTTEEENIAMARFFHEEGTNARNPAALFEILDPNVIHHAAGGYADTTSAEGVVGMMSQFPPAFSDLHYTIDFLVVEDDLVVERYTASGTQDGPLGDLPPSGRAATWTGINIYRIECGKIVEIWSEVDAMRRMEQLTGAVDATPAP